MANTVVDVRDAAVTDFVAEAHLAFEAEQHDLDRTVRVRDGVVGDSVKFQKIGKGDDMAPWDSTARGNVPTAELSHDNVSADINDALRALPVSKFDEAKINIDERGAIRNRLTSAGHRAIDHKVAEAMVTSHGHLADKSSSGSIDLAFFEELFQKMGGADVPDDGDRWGAMSYTAWTQMLQIGNVSQAEYVPESQLPFAGGRIPTVLDFFGFKNFVCPNLPLGSAGVRWNFHYHRSCVGYARQTPFNITPSWIGEKHYWLFTAEIGHGSVTIDTTGVFATQLAEGAGNAFAAV